MRSNWKILIAAAAALLVVPQLAMADDIDEQLRQMNERMAQMEEQLQATNDELDASMTRVESQQQLIEKAGLDREAQSGLSEFLNSTQFSGYVSASYNYNFNQPNANTLGVGTNAGVNPGSAGLTAPFHQNHNSFQLDQFFLSMMKPATAESRGGFGVDLVWGAAADIQGNHGFNGTTGTGDNSHLFQAYVEYLADVGEGVNIKLGRFTTIVGAESFRDDENWQITRGAAWALQPVNHTGILASTTFGDGFDITVGGANSYGNNNFDADNSKTFIGGIGWTGETASIHLNSVLGGDVSDIAAFGPAAPNGPGKNSDSITLIDLVATWEPTENLSAWVNLDFYEFSNSGSPFISGLDIITLANSMRYAVNDATGIAFRHEFVKFNDVSAFPGALSGVQDATLHTLTTTLDHALTDNLTLKLEGRWDNWDVQSGPQGGAGNGIFFTNGNFVKDRDQFLMLAQALYRF